MVKYYLLRHTYRYGKNCEHEETKELGVYSSYDKAQQAMEYYFQQPGFNRYPKSCFFADEFTLDTDCYWLEGFNLKE